MRGAAAKSEACCCVKDARPGRAPHPPFCVSNQVRWLERSNGPGVKSGMWAGGSRHNPDQKDEGLVIEE